MKTMGKILVVTLLLFGALSGVGYYVISRPADTIDRNSNPTAVNNLHLIDRDPETGFEIYRMGEPDALDMRGLCELGVTEIVVLAGTAHEHEGAYRDECPTLEVIYNVEDDLAPLSSAWLERFDSWVGVAQAQGKKIAFRCTCGCHRTGRLAAYYQMKYRGLSAKDAWDLALTRGAIMEPVDYFAGLQQQIIALSEQIQGEPCSQGEYCVIKDGPAQPLCDDPMQGCGWQSRYL